MNNRADAIYDNLRSEIEREVTWLLRRHVRAINARTNEEENEAASSALIDGVFTSLIEAAGKTGIREFSAADQIQELVDEIKDEADDHDHPADAAKPEVTALH
jgi:hypothetical protein